MWLRTGASPASSLGSLLLKKEKRGPVTEACPAGLAAGSWGGAEGPGREVHALNQDSGGVLWGDEGSFMTGQGHWGPQPCPGLRTAIHG